MKVDLSKVNWEKLRRTQPIKPYYTLNGKKFYRTNNLRIILKAK